MKNLESIAEYKSFTNQELHECIIDSHIEIESGFVNNGLNILRLFIHRSIFVTLVLK